MCANSAFRLITLLEKQHLRGKHPSLPPFPLHPSSLLSPPALDLVTYNVNFRHTLSLSLTGLEGGEGEPEKEPGEEWRSRRGRQKFGELKLRQPLPANSSIQLLLFHILTAWTETRERLNN